MSRIGLMLAYAGEKPWANRLADGLEGMPVCLYRSHCDAEAVDLAASGKLSVGVVDEDLPQAGGLEVLHRIRRAGLVLPVLLVSDRPDQRWLLAALGLDAFSVLAADGRMELLVPLVLKAARRAGPGGRYRTGDSN